MDMTSQGSETATATMKRRQGNAGYTRAAVKTLFACMLILITINAAVALSITDIQAPSTITEGNLLQLSFTTDTSATYRILQDGIEVSASDSYDEQLGFTTAGLRTYTFEASDANTTINETRIIEILDTALSITLNEPASSDYATTIIPVQLETNIAADVCYTVTDATTHTLTQDSPTSYSGSLTLTDGLHIVEFKCNLNGEIAQEERTIKVDTTPPTMSLGPSGAVDDQVILTATTSEVSTCKYGTSHQQYSDLPGTFPETTSLTHQQELDPGEGSHTYYVACRDVYGNTAASQSTTFTLREKPSARLSIEGGNPHKAGSYDFTLEVSEQLREPPKLTIVYQGGSSQALVLTEVGDTEYEGVIIVPDNAGEKVASFSFSGTDLSGLAGTRIEESELFLIDTIKPNKVETFRAVNGSGGVNLSWYYDGEDDVQFNIYRTSGLGVGYNDFFTTTIGDAYLDTDTTAAVKFYYRIAAEDDAGNIGPLSHEEWASPAAAKHAAQDTGAFLDPVLQVDLDARIDIIEGHILDGERSLEDLRKEESDDKAWLVSTLGLDNDAGQSLKTFKDAKTRLEALRTKSLTLDQFKNQATAIQEVVDAALTKLPFDLEVKNRAEYDEVADQQALDAAVTHALRGKVVAEGEKQAYLEAARALQDEVHITTTATIVSITYADGRTKSYAIVEKRLLSDNPQANLLAIETVPKAVVPNTITFLSAEPTQLEEDIFQYSFDTLVDETLVYATQSDVSLPTMRQSRLVVLPVPGVMTVAVENSMTGGALGFLSFDSSSQNLVVILGLIIVIGLAAYYLSIRDDNPKPLHPEREHTIMHAGPSTMTLAPASMTQTVLVHRKHEPLVGLLLHGHELADETRYLDALHFYRQALARFDEERFSSNRLKESVRQELVLLHAKISLLETMSKAHDSCYLGDTALLARQMRAMRTHAETVGDESTKLVEKSKAQYGYFYNKLNAIKLENERLSEEEQPL
ncbi:hypothetical protein GOV07_04210 [Candidatus Woesearchaeota archaeon]|nr:hypothetical protein [Candidatus Woesearchaeota archaeon]